MGSNASSPFGVLGDRQNLSPQARADILKLSGPRPIPFLLTALYAWAVIIGIIWSALVAHSAWVSLFVIFIVATRKNMLGLLVHDQAHCLGFPTRPGDLITNLIAAYPLLASTVEDYAQVHLYHHKFSSPRRIRISCARATQNGLSQCQA